MDTRLQNFLLPLAAGAILALPMLFLTRARENAEPPAMPARPQVQATCGPFVASFTAMRAEAERIANLATTAAAPADGTVSFEAAAPAWREIAASARALDSWMWEANTPNAPLTLKETTVVAGAAPIASELRWDTADIANQLVAGVSGEDLTLLIRRMDSIARAAASVARALDPLTVCEAPIVTYAPQGDCSSREPEYQYAMAGPCLY